ncbi:MAG: glycosyltransferase family 2 protein [Deltaproteobacteria bacterium]|nr:MAG: glycosyltransferase family 2 protein [Deltaproteobacteria bacterium]
MNESPYKVRSPVVLLVFNRPDTTRAVFEKIAEARPESLYVIADGPRPGYGEDPELCRQVLEIVSAPSWPCRLVTDISEVNLGTMRRIVSGLDRVFEQEERAVILEDDCVPDNSFFRFCDELLHRYAEDNRIAQVSGGNFQLGRRRTDCSYYFSRYSHCWGWATWRRAWRCNDADMIHWPDFRDRKRLRDVLDSSREIAYWEDVLEKVYLGEIDSWACRWLLSCWREHMVNIVPEVNLVSNVGFGPDATRTTGYSPFAGLPVETMPFPLSHPSDVLPHRLADEFTSARMFRHPGLVRRVLGLLGGPRR